jgi:ABC-2 type transport system ATP-binding protein
MADAAEFWRVWAPYWERMEDRHFGRLATERIAPGLKPPVLVVGAGQGIAVELLQKRGLETVGLDLDPEMVREARARRGLDLVLGDARALPFPRNRFGAVVLSSGVLDYQEDEGVARQILAEALRVLQPYGDLWAAFYQLPPVVARVSRRLGLLEERCYHLGRLFWLLRTVRERPLACIPAIARWSGRGQLSSGLYWTRLGLWLPRELRQDSRLVEGILEAARARGEDVERLWSATPDSLPYRDEAAVQRLFASLGLAQTESLRLPDCLVVRHHKSCLSGLAEQASGEVIQAAPGEVAVQTRGLWKRYPGAPRPAVEALELAIPRGSVFGILGPNGAGKTTTLQMLAGLLPPDGGEIAFAPDIARGGLRRRIGTVPQELALYPRLTARENLRFFGRLYGLGGSRLRARVGALLDVVGLAERAGDRVADYSSGMMRRLNLAAGLLHEPDILLLDEPTVGIDPQSRNLIFEAIADLKRRGVTILYTTHYMEEASRLCDQVAILDRGRVILAGPPRELVRRHGLRRLGFGLRSGDLGAAEAAIGAEPEVFWAGQEQAGLQVLARAAADGQALVDRLRAVARQAGAELGLERSLEPDLESLFLDLTGRSLRDGGEG